MKQFLVIVTLIVFSNFSFSQSQFSGSALTFIKNKGQVVNQNGKLNSNVKYILPTNIGMNIQLLTDGFSYDLYATKNNSVIFNRIDIKFENCNTNIEIFEEDKQIQTSNYYKAGLQSIVSTKVNQFKTVTYKNVYPNIDIVFKSTQNGFKYDVILNPGAKMIDIKFRYSGMDSFELIDNQTLSLGTNIRVLDETIPLSFYKNSKKEVDVNFQVLDNQNKTILIGFDLESKLKTNETLIIDPVPQYVWSNYQGDSLITTTNGVITDRFGYVYICGKTMSVTNIATAGAYQDTIYNLFDAYVKKYNQGGGIVWSTYFGGNHNDVANDVYIDTSFHVYLAGTTFSNAGLIDTLGNQDSLAGLADAFLARLTEDGTLDWSTYQGGDSLDYGLKLSVDFSENIYLSGQTESTNGIAYGNSYQSNLNGINDGFVTKYNSAGQIQWSTYLGGSNNDIATGISFGDTSIFVVGETNSNDFPVSVNAHKATLTGNTDGFISKFNPDGDLVWSTYYGGELDDKVNSIKTLNNNVYFIGTTNSDSSIVTPLAFKLTKNDSTDAFVGKMNRHGVLKWCSYYGGDSTDLGVDLFFELDSNILITGTTFSDTLAGTNGDTYQLNNGGKSDVFVSKILKNGELEWSTFYGGPEDDNAEAIAVYGNTAIYVVGNTKSDSAIVVDYQINPNNSYDSFSEGFVTKFKQTKSTLPYGIGGSCNAGSGGSGTIDTTLSTGGTYEPNYYCIGDTVLLTVVGGELGTDAEWFWYANNCGDSQTIGTGDSIYVVVTTTTTFFVRVESNTNASSECTYNTIYVAPNNPVTIINDSTACSGTEFIFTHSNNGTVNWFGPNNFTSTDSMIIINEIDTSYSGTYYINAIDDYGCFYYDTLDLIVNPSPFVNTEIIDANCFGYNSGSIIVTGDSLINYTYDWITYDTLSTTNLIANDSLLSVNSGQYAVTIINQFNCTYIDSFLITQPNSFLLDTTILPTLCLDSTGIIMMDLNQSVAPFSIIWTPTQQTNDTVIDLNYGWHSVTIISEEKCIENHSFFIPNYNNFEANITSSSESNCPDVPTGSATATGVNGTLPYTYDWINYNQTNQTATNLDTGFVMVYVYDNSGCYAFDSVYISAKHTLEVESVIVNSNCGGTTGSISMLVDNPNDYSVLFSNGINNQWQIDNLSAGTYSVVVTDTFGCNYNYNYYIDILNDLQVWANPSDTTLTMGSPAVIDINSNSSSALTYDWNPITDLDCSSCQSTTITPMSTGNYSIIVTDDMGCIDTAYFNYDIIIPCIDVYIPTIFSPNNDQLNDNWVIIGSCITSINTKVYNQWGQLLFESNDLNITWNGYYQGSKVMNDNYSYTISVMYDDGTSETFNGLVTVID